MNKTINSLSDLILALKEYDDLVSSQLIFRGSVSADHPLVPKVGRLQSVRTPKLDENEEKLMLDLFKKQAGPFVDGTPEGDWEWLAIAHRHGVPTRLLEWTRNPLVGCFFALEHEIEGDSAIHVFKGVLPTQTGGNDSPFAFKGVLKVNPPKLDPTISAQSSLFTAHSNPHAPFESEHLDKLVIPKKVRIDMKKDLYKVGIHKASIYPGLDGLAAHIRWLRTDEY